MDYQTHYDCKNGNERGNCIYNGTLYKMCLLEREIVCYDPKAITKNWWLEAQSLKKYKKVLTHVLHKRGVEPVIPTCDKCNHSVWSGEKIE